MQTWFIVYLQVCCADKRAFIRLWHATDNARSSSTSWNASRVWRARLFLFCSRLNKDVLQKQQLPFTAFMSNGKITLLNIGVDVENVKDHWEILEILLSFFFSDVINSSCPSASWMWAVIRFSDRWTQFIFQSYIFLVIIKCRVKWNPTSAALKGT